MSPELVYLGQGYLPPVVGSVLGVLLFAVAVVLTWRQRSKRKTLGLALAPLWRDVLRVVVIGVVLVAFIQTLNRYDGIPVPVLILLVLLGVFSYITSQTVFGRRIYAVGSNLEATRLSGINVQAIKLGIFGLMGRDVRPGRSGQHRPPGRRLALGRHHGRTGRHRRLLHRRHLHARRLGHRLRRPARRPGDRQSGQWYVHARRGQLLADDRQGQHPGPGGLGRRQHPHQPA